MIRFDVFGRPVGLRRQSGKWEAYYLGHGQIREVYKGI